MLPHSCPQTEDNTPSHLPLTPCQESLSPSVAHPGSLHLDTTPLGPSKHLGAGMTVAMVLTEGTESRHQHQQRAASAIVPTVGPALAQVACGSAQAPAAALVRQAAQAGGVGGTGRRTVGLQEEEGDLLGGGAQVRPAVKARSGDRTVAKGFSDSDSVRTRTQGSSRQRV